MARFSPRPRLALDRAVLPGGDQSSFVIKVPVNGDVALLPGRVPDQNGTVVSHVDKRTPARSRTQEQP